MSIYRVIAAARDGSMLSCESCNLPFLICVILLKDVLRTSPDGEALPDEPVCAPTRTGSSPPLYLETPSALFKKRAFDQYWFGRALLVRASRYSATVRVQTLVNFI